MKKASIKFWEDLLYFQSFMYIFVFCPKSVIIITLNVHEVLVNRLGGQSLLRKRVVKVVISGKYKNLNKITKI